MHFVIIPGIDNSDQAHWQSIWETEWGASAARIDVASWEKPELDDWCWPSTAPCVRRVRAQSWSPTALAVWLPPSGRQPTPPCPEGCSWSAHRTLAVHLSRVSWPALLLSTPNPYIPQAWLCPATTNSFCTLERAEQLARGWGLPLISVGPLGHINSASGLGRWEDGRALLTAFTAGLTVPSVPRQP